MSSPGAVTDPVAARSLLRIAMPIVLSSMLTLVLSLNDTVAYGALALGLGPLGVAASTVLGVGTGAAVLVRHRRTRSGSVPVPRPALMPEAVADRAEVWSIGLPEALQLTFAFGAGLVVAVLVAPAALRTWPPFGPSMPCSCCCMC